MGETTEDTVFVYHMMQQESWDVPQEIADQLVSNNIARDDGMSGYIVESYDPGAVEDAMRDFGYNPS